jgi:hypothetical protein
VPGQTLPRNIFKKYFSMDFNAQKIFLDFYKNRKGARKDSSMQKKQFWKFQICSGKISKVKKSKFGGKLNMRYVPIYLRQGLVVLSLTSGTFLLH